MQSQWIIENFPEIKGKYFGKLLKDFENQKVNKTAVRKWIKENIPKTIPLQDPVFHCGNQQGDFLDKGEEDSIERINWSKVNTTLLRISKTPTVRQIAVMPDACPTGDKSVPVGSIIKAENAIHPGWHSSDVCCSLMVTNLGIGWTLKDGSSTHGPGIYQTVLDTVQMVTHFGRGGRPNGQRFTISPRLFKEALENPFLSSDKSLQLMTEHLGTQGDGNHFAYVGVLESTGELCLVTHHGSRGFGARLYKEGMKTAETYRKKISPDTSKENAWIPFDTQDGQDYWEALQIVRKWTKANHNCIHQAVCDELGVTYKDRFWNEHNFVFKTIIDNENYFYHAKGATPVDKFLLPDTDGRMIIPMNMVEPVLIVKNDDDQISDNPSMGFAPHGAGRLVSRSKHFNNQKEKYGEENEDTLVTRVMEDETKGLDVRFYSGEPDISELPSAYKNAETVQSEIKKHNLCDIVDRIIPYGSIMAGDLDKNAPWRKKRTS